MRQERWSAVTELRPLLGDDSKPLGSLEPNLVKQLDRCRLIRTRVGTECPAASSAVIIRYHIANQVRDCDDKVRWLADPAQCYPQFMILTPHAWYANRRWLISKPCSATMIEMAAALPGGCRPNRASAAPATSNPCAAKPARA